MSINTAGFDESPKAFKKLYCRDFLRHSRPRPATASRLSGRPSSTLEPPDSGEVGQDDSLLQFILEILLSEEQMPSIAVPEDCWSSERDYPFLNIFTSEQRIFLAWYLTNHVVLMCQDMKLRYGIGPGRVDQIEIAVKGFLATMSQIYEGKDVLQSLPPGTSRRRRREAQLLVQGTRSHISEVIKYMCKRWATEFKEEDVASAFAGLCSSAGQISKAVVDALQRDNTPGPQAPEDSSEHSTHPTPLTSNAQSSSNETFIPPAIRTAVAEGLQEKIGPLMRVEGDNVLIDDEKEEHRLNQVLSNPVAMTKFLK